MKTGLAGDEPARCAGLRRALLHDWQDRFPIEQSPFNVMARQLGGSLREVLGHCHTLSDEGALDAIRVRWSPVLERVRWRCGWRLATTPAPELLAMLPTLPGVTHWEWVQPHGNSSHAGPNFWLHLAARDRRSAQAQLERLEQQAGKSVVVAHDDDPPAPVPCTCAHDGGPCADVHLARRCEAGLPMVSRPYRALSQGVQRSEREVLAVLRRWERAGRLRSVGFDLLPPCRERHGLAVAVGGPPVPPEVRRALMAEPGITEAQSLKPVQAWPYPLWVSATGVPAQAQGTLQRALERRGLATRPHRYFLVRHVHVRAAPLLFADDGEGLDDGTRPGPVATA